MRDKHFLFLFSVSLFLCFPLAACHAAGNPRYAATLSAAALYEMPRAGAGIGGLGYGNPGMQAEGAFYLFLKGHNYSRLTASAGFFGSNEVAAGAGFEAGRMFRIWSLVHPYAGIGTNLCFRKMLFAPDRSWLFLLPVFLGCKFPRGARVSGFEAGIMPELYGGPSQVYFSVDVSAWVKR